MDTLQDSIFRDLEKMGFGLNESKVYLTLIGLGPSLAGKVAKEARMDRSSTYNALKSLVQQGIVSTVHENKRTIYLPENPKKILDYYQEKEELAKRIIPRLEKQFTFKKPKSSVRLFQGYKGLKTVLQDILDSTEKGKTYFVMGSEGFFSQKMPYYSPVFKRRKESKQIKTKSLIREGRHKTSGRYAEYKTVPSDVESPATINIYGNKVAIFIWEDNPQAILIENENVKKTLENYFDFIWKNAKK